MFKVKISMGPVPPTGTNTIKSGSLANSAAANNSLDKPTARVFSISERSRRSSQLNLQLKL